MNDLQEMKQEIEQQQEDLRFQKDLIHKLETLQLVEELLVCEVDYFKLLGEALAHWHFGIAPKTKELGYVIARYSKPEYDSKEWDKYMSILKFINDHDYVFATTHYDCCDNGFFYRQS